MLPDVTLNDYYYKFIDNNKFRIKELNNKLNNIAINKSECHKYLTDNLDAIKQIVGIDLNTCEEYTNKQYVEKMKSRNIALNFIRNNNDTAKKVLTIAILKYCSLLINEYKYNKELNIRKEYIKLNYIQYKDIVSNYYNKVHKVLLQGYAYKFNCKLGSFVINRWNFDEDKTAIVDYNETNKRKKEIIAAGKKPYNNAEAKYYKDHGLEYDGVPYIVYKSIDKWYEFRFIGRRETAPKYIDFQKTEYINAKFRGMTHQQMADTFCKTEDDIYNLPVDIKVKLNILLYKNPSAYLNFIRTNNRFFMDREHGVRFKNS